MMKGQFEAHCMFVCALLYHLLALMSTPRTPLLVLTPLNKAVAVPAESGTLNYHILYDLQPELDLIKSLSESKSRYLLSSTDSLATLHKILIMIISSHLFVRVICLNNPGERKLFPRKAGLLSK